MQGIYIHIPFCKKACLYCDFHFSTSLQQKGALISAIEKEIELQKNYLPGKTIDTIYFGGGTPSLAEVSEIASLLNKINSTFSVSPTAEITLEANPDDINTEKVKALASIGINRLSLGVQSFFDEDLLWMGRAHNATEALKCIPVCQDSGITVLNIDLIYGFPTLSDEKWQKNIETVLNSGAQHLSAYSLTVEPKTALSHQIQKGKMPDIKPEQAARHFEMLMDAIAEKGWEHYEISNYSQPGRYAVHNTNYWKNMPYLGLGPSAHSFNGHSRQWNIKNNAEYIKAVIQSQLPSEEEILSVYDRFNEMVMTGLRTMWGVDLKSVEQNFGIEFRRHLETSALPYLQRGLLHKDGSTLTLTRKGKPVADFVSSELFWV